VVAHCSKPAVRYDAHMTASASFRPPGSLPTSPLGRYAGPWDVRLAAHLLRRAGFGGTLADRARFAETPMALNVDALLNVASPTAGTPTPDLIDTERFGPEVRRIRAMRSADGMAATLRPNDGADPMAPAGSDGALQEKMTLFLHGNFATATNQKGIYGLDIIAQNQLLRSQALGNFVVLTHGVARDRAMLKYLDNARSNRDHPNENFARELMELFTLGIGKYTEQDVRESARAFTGYTFQRRTGEFFVNARQHDDGRKTFLGKAGNFTGDDVIDIIFEQPAAATFLARKLLEFFVYTDPEPQLVDELAAVVRREKFELAPVMSTLLRSNVFYSERAYRALVKSPVEFVVGSYQLFGIEKTEPGVIAILNRMGQLPFHPPNVKGWDGGAAWLSTQTVLARENFASSLMAASSGARGPLFDGLPPSAHVAAQRLVGTILLGDASQSAMAKLAAYLDGADTSLGGALSGENVDERMRGAAYLTMAMPAYQLS
jgi:uncharacterized protein (DUF1800 family)